MMAKYGNDKEDACSCLRWNHICCLNCCMCKSCNGKTKDHFDKFEETTYYEFQDYVSKSCDFDKDKDKPLPKEILADDVDFAQAIASDDEKVPKATGLPKIEPKPKRGKGKKGREERKRSKQEIS